MAKNNELIVRTGERMVVAVPHENSRFTKTLRKPWILQINRQLKGLSFSALQLDAKILFCFSVSKCFPKNCSNSRICWYGEIIRPQFQNCVFLRKCAAFITKVTFSINNSLKTPIEVQVDFDKLRIDAFCLDIEKFGDRIPSKQWVGVANLRGLPVDPTVQRLLVRWQQRKLHRICGKQMRGPWRVVNL